MTHIDLVPEEETILYLKLGGETHAVDLFLLSMFINEIYTSLGVEQGDTVPFTTIIPLFRDKMREQGIAMSIESAYHLYNKVVEDTDAVKKNTSTSQDPSSSTESSQGQNETSDS